MHLARVWTLDLWKKLVRWSMIGVALYALAGFVALPSLLKWVVASQLTQRLHPETTIQAISFNPFRLALQVNNFSVKDRNGAALFVSFDELALNFEVASLWEWGFVVREATLKRLRVAMVRNDDRSYNFSDLLTELIAKPKS